MRSSMVVLAALWFGCSSTSGPSDAPADNAGIDGPVADAPLSCESGFVRGYLQGCSAAPTCVRDTSGDAVAITYCGCDGVSHIGGGQWPPAARWASSGPCPDGGTTDVPATDAPATDAPLTCPLPPIDTAVCTRDADCATATRGCYCGQQPVFGVNVANRDAVQRCEVEAMRNCALGCPIAAGQVAQDGQSVTDGGAVSVRCEVSDGGATGSCRTWVPR